jgi:hypothetical protein
MLARLFFLQQHIMCVCLYFSLGEKFLGPEENNSMAARLLQDMDEEEAQRSSLLFSILTDGRGGVGSD